MKKKEYILLLLLSIHWVGSILPMKFGRMPNFDFKKFNFRFNTDRWRRFNLGSWCPQRPVIFKGFFKARNIKPLIGGLGLTSLWQKEDFNDSKFSGMARDAVLSDEQYKQLINTLLGYSIPERRAYLKKLSPALFNALATNKDLGLVLNIVTKDGNIGSQLYFDILEHVKDAEIFQKMFDNFGAVIYKIANKNLAFEMIGRFITYEVYNVPREFIRLYKPEMMNEAVLDFLWRFHLHQYNLKKEDYDKDIIANNPYISVLIRAIPRNRFESKVEFEEVLRNSESLD